MTHVIVHPEAEVRAMTHIYLLLGEITPESRAVPKERQKSLQSVDFGGVHPNVASRLRISGKLDGKDFMAVISFVPEGHGVEGRFIPSPRE